MSNFTIDINIKAPELIGALERLTAALGKPVTINAEPKPVPQPIQTAPVPPTPVPQTVAAPTSPAQQPQQVPVQTAAPQAPVQAAPAAAPGVKTYTMDEIAKAAADFMTPANIPQLQALLASFGVSALPDLPADKFGSFATALREMGAKI